MKNKKIEKINVEEFIMVKVLICQNMKMEIMYFI